MNQQLRIEVSGDLEGDFVVIEARSEDEFGSPASPASPRSTMPASTPGHVRPTPRSSRPSRPSTDRFSRPTARD